MDRLAAVARRFLTERSFTLIVAPALADFLFERSRGASRAGAAWVYWAVASAACEDLTSDLSSLRTFATLALLPACYYVFLFLLCAPWAFSEFGLKGTALGLVGVTALVVSLSTLSAIVCFWPAKLTEPAEHEGPRV
jgi:hypothetical protein